LILIAELFQDAPKPIQPSSWDGVPSGNDSQTMISNFFSRIQMVTSGLSWGLFSNLNGKIALKAFEGKL
jgi:hypothetical protein